MLFSYALLFFLFTTFATAAPTMMLQKRSPYDLEDNTNFLVANGGEWTRDKSVSRLDIIFWLLLTYVTEADGNIDIFYSHLHLSHPSQQGSQVNTIKWLTKSLTYQDYGYKPNELYVEIKETEHWVAQLRPNEKPGNDLLGTWEREKTVSISRLEGIDFSYTQRISYRVARSKSYNTTIILNGSGSKF